MLRVCRDNHSEFFTSRAPRWLSGEMRKLYFLFIFSFFLLSSSAIKACQCPPTSLSLGECAKYELIFRGRIISVTACENKRGSAIFQISELYKGASTASLQVVFDCNTECTQTFNVGEEWIIYTVYKQIDNAKMDWCSRSRKFIKNLKEDFYVLNLGNTYDDELSFLRKNLGNHSFIKEKLNQEENRNELPSRKQLIIYLAFGLAGIIIFYYLFKKFVK